MKAWYESKTILAGMATFATLLLSTGYESYKDKTISTEQIVAVVAGAYSLKKVIDGRGTATEPIFTPKGFEGKNKPTVEEKLDGMLQASRQKELEHETVIQQQEEESKSNGEISELKILGLEGTNRNYSITFTKDSVIKASLTDSSLLSASEILEVPQGKTYEIAFYKRDALNHIAINFVKDGANYYVYIPHVIVKNAKGEEVSLSDHSPVLAAVQKTKTSYTLPNGTFVYLEDPVIPGGHISWGEFTHSGTRVFAHIDDVANAKAVCTVVEKVRNHFKKPITVTSGYRDPVTNANVGGSTKSTHVLAAAMDIWIDGVDPESVYQFLNASHSGGLARSKYFTHIDVAGMPDTQKTCPGYASRRRWTY
jgi:hypothetical protein